ncbi:MAG: hypothetical protein ACK55Z_11595, partial [bacterium]
LYRAGAGVTAPGPDRRAHRRAGGRDRSVPAAARGGRSGNRATATAGVGCPRRTRGGPLPARRRTGRPAAAGARGPQTRQPGRAARHHHARVQ